MVEFCFIDFFLTETFFDRKNVFQKPFFFEFGFKYNTNIAPESPKVPNIKEIFQLKNLYHKLNEFKKVSVLILSVVGQNFHSIVNILLREALVISKR